MNATTALIIAGGALTAFLVLRPVLRRHTAGLFDDIGYRRALWKRRREANRRRVAN